MNSIALVTLLHLAPSAPPATAAVMPDHALELGVAAGLFMAGQNTGLSHDGQTQMLGGAGLDLSLRIGYRPFAFIGVEAEAGHVQLAHGDARGELYSARGHLIVLYPATFTPFVVAGGGLMGLTGRESFMGADHHPAAHYGAGVKTMAMQGVTLRADARHVLAFSDVGLVNHFELTFGASFTIGLDAG